MLYNDSNNFCNKKYIVVMEELLPYMISDAFSRPIHHKLSGRFLYPEPGRGIKIHVKFIVSFF